MLELSEIRKLLRNGKIITSVHILEQLDERDIKYSEVKRAINEGEIIEQYPDAYPYPACLVLYINIDGIPLHVVVASDSEYITLVTAYRPSIDRFESDWKTRKRR